MVCSADTVVLGSQFLEVSPKFGSDRENRNSHLMLSVQIGADRFVLKHVVISSSQNAGQTTIHITFVSTI
jgi:hypothetical protein